jgi:hypothetical protein
MPTTNHPNYFQGPSTPQVARAGLPDPKHRPRLDFTPSNSGSRMDFDRKWDGDPEAQMATMGKLSNFIQRNLGNYILYRSAVHGGIDDEIKEQAEHGQTLTGEPLPTLGQPTPGKPTWEGATIGQTSRRNNPYPENDDPIPVHTAGSFGTTIKYPPKPVEGVDFERAKSFGETIEFGQLGARKFGRQGFQPSVEPPSTYRTNRPKNAGANPDAIRKSREGWDLV